jgi:hypothetical protein
MATPTTCGKAKSRVTHCSIDEFISYYTIVHNRVAYTSNILIFTGAIIRSVLHIFATKHKVSSGKRNEKNETKRVSAGVYTVG